MSDPQLAPVLSESETMRLINLVVSSNLDGDSKNVLVRQLTGLRDERNSSGMMVMLLVALISDWYVENGAEPGPDMKIEIPISRILKVTDLLKEHGRPHLHYSEEGENGVIQITIRK